LPFVGREAELHTLTHLLAAPDRRSLTIAGAGETGKTRLAVDVVPLQPVYSFCRSGVVAPASIR